MDKKIYRGEDYSQSSLSETTINALGGVVARVISLDIPKQREPSPEELYQDEISIELADREVKELEALLALGSPEAREYQEV